MNDTEPKSEEWTERSTTLEKLRETIEQVHCKNAKEIIENFILQEENRDPDDPIIIEPLIENIKKTENSEETLKSLTTHVKAVEKYLDGKLVEKKTTKNLETYRKMLSKYREG